MSITTNNSAANKGVGDKKRKRNGDNDVASEVDGKEKSGEDGVRYVRITSGGKIKLWVNFALEFLRENPGKPLVLHTLPPKNPSGSEDIPECQHVKEEDEKEEVKKEEEDSNQVENHEDEVTSKSESVEDASETAVNAAACTTTIPRLITVAEIIKREYLKAQKPRLEDGKSIVGLYQYNYLGCYEDENGRTGESQEDTEEEESRKLRIRSLLEGKNHLRVEKTPYMRITLCTAPISPEAELLQAATFQPPEKKKLSKGARARLRKRLRKGKREDEG